MSHLVPFPAPVTYSFQSLKPHSYCYFCISLQSIWSCYCMQYMAMLVVIIIFAIVTCEAVNGFCYSVRRYMYSHSQTLKVRIWLVTHLKVNQDIIPTEIFNITIVPSVLCPQIPPSQSTVHSLPTCSSYLICPCYVRHQFVY